MQDQTGKNPVVTVQAKKLPSGEPKTQQPVEVKKSEEPIRLTKPEEKEELEEESEEEADELDEEVDEGPDKTPEESWYIKKKEITRKILGVPTRIKVIKGVEYTRLSRKCMVGKTIDQEKYGTIMINKCIIEPAVDVNLLSPAAFTMIVLSIEDALGLSEVAQKKALTR